MTGLDILKVVYQGMTVIIFLLAVIALKLIKIMRVSRITAHNTRVIADRLRTKEGEE